MLADIQVKMRLVTTGDKMQIRQSYIPALFPRVVGTLAEEGVVSYSNCTASKLELTW
jgi:replication factor C subunit 1